jgi:hypothetical protein
MRYKVGDRNVNIPDAVIEQGMKEGLTRQETVDRYLSDEGIVVDATVAELTAKAKDAGTGAKGTADKPKRKAPVRKPDEVKRALIAALAEFITEQPHVENVDVTNIERMVAFDFAGDKFEITLTKKRKPKE